MPDESQMQLLRMLQLNLVPGIGPRMRRALLDRFGSAEKILRATVPELRSVSGIGPKLAKAIVAGVDEETARHELELCEQNSVSILSEHAGDLPRLLTEIHDPPTYLYCRGTVEPRDELSIAIVGSRRCTAYGRRIAERLSASLARAGMTIVSGLARGIDGIAHRAALEAGGRTMAVLGSGVLNIYPPEHKELAAEIEKHGAVISEFPVEQRPSPGLFPQRNRIISGMSCGVIIIEATRTSGSLYTARHAMEQGRLVFAVPGQVTSIASEGCLELIRDGAILCRHADDILSELGPLPQPTTQPTPSTTAAPEKTVHTPRELTLNEREREVLNLVPAEATHVDEILRSSDIASNLVLSTLTILEMKRMIRRLQGGYFIRSPE